MKTFIVFALVALCVIALCQDASASDADKAKATTPSPKDAKNAGKDAAKKKKECARDCGTAYDPICAHDPANPGFKPRTFGSQCAMDVVNCEMGTKLVVKNRGDCAGAGGVRLS